jgi:hypothetical protein
MYNEKESTMKKSVLWLTLVLGGVTALAGCSQRPPKCSDPDTIAIVSDLIIELYIDDKRYGNHDWLKIGSDKLTKDEQLALFSIKSVQKTGYDKELQLYSCEAELQYGKDVEPIVYNTYLSDENGNHMVELERLSQYPAERVNLYFRTVITEKNKGN